MSGSEPGGAREKEQGTESKAEEGGRLCTSVCVCCYIKHGEQWGVCFTFWTAAGLQPYLDLTLKRFLFSFAVE